MGVEHSTAELRETGWTNMRSKDPKPLSGMVMHELGDVHRTVESL